VSVAEALSDLPKATTENGDLTYSIEAKTKFQKIMRKGNLKITDHLIPKMSELDKYIVAYVKPGGKYMDIPNNVVSKRIRRLQQTGGHTTCYGRLSPSQPAYTINTYFNRPNVGCNIHYKENRLITVREALRLQTFPDKYKIISVNKQGRNTIVGNAVPPLLAKIIANELKKQLK
jgi:DNA (cytosine-5)-methyltransferase 1